MRGFWKSCAATAVAVAVLASHAWGAALDTPEPASPGAVENAFGASLIEHRLGVEMTVHNWVLCASQPFAEELVHAREVSRDAAVRALADLETARSCGRLAEMQVILQESLYEAVLRSGGQAKVYDALVNISGAWASGFVVYGGMPEN